MTDTAATSPQSANAVGAGNLRESFRRLDRRQWWLWSLTVLVLILLVLTIATFAFPMILVREEQTYSFFLNQAVRGLVGLVLLFAVYSVYQQYQIIRMRNQLADQLDTLNKVENLTAEVYKLAALDPLTGLYNRRSGEQRLAQEMSRAVRHGRPLTLLLIDVDDLKIINDRFGHAAGDLLLKGFAERMQRAIRGSDLAVRMGGDEFLILLPECRVDEVQHVLSRLQNLEVQYNRDKVGCHFSCGWADFRVGETAEEFLGRADAALYEDKRARKRESKPLPTPTVPQPAT